MHGKWAKIQGGGFKPEEATDKLTCPYVRWGYEGEREGHSEVLGEGVELNLVNVGPVGNWMGREKRVWDVGAGKGLE